MKLITPYVIMWQMHVVLRRVMLQRWRSCHLLPCKIKLTEKEVYLHEYIRYTLQQKRTDLTLLFNRRLGIPALQFLHKQKSHLQELSQTLTNITKERCNTEKHSLALLAQQLESLNPLQMMVKGFAKVEHDNEPITSVSQLQANDDIRVTLVDGYVTATVKEAHKDGRITKKL